jgi:DNA replication protein DnaC
MNTEIERAAYKKHVHDRALERFEALDLGPLTREMGIVDLPPGEWSFPPRAAERGGKLILTGPSGSGKSTLLKRIAWSLALRNWKPRGGYVPTILGKIKSKGSDEYLDWLMGGTLLVLDDFDKMGGTRYEGEKFLAMINHYDVHGHPILVTMNIEMSAFEGRVQAGGIPQDYAEAIVSRLMNRSTNFLVPDEDHRRMSS